MSVAVLVVFVSGSLWGQEPSTTNKVLESDLLESKAQKLAQDLEENEAIVRRAREIAAEKRATKRYEKMVEQGRWEKFVEKYSIEIAMEKSGLAKLQRLNKRADSRRSYGLTLQGAELEELKEALLNSATIMEAYKKELARQITILSTPKGTIQLLMQWEKEL